MYLEGVGNISRNESEHLTFITRGLVQVRNLYRRERVGGKEGGGGGGRGGWLG